MRHAIWHSIFLALVSGLAFIGVARAAELGAIVPNTAEVTYTYGGSSVTVLTNIAAFQIEARRTDSTIEFLRYFPAGSNQSVMLNGADYSPDGSLTGPFTPIGPASSPGGPGFATGSPTPVVATDTYLPGEMILVRVTDLGQNGDPNQIETIVAVVTASPGDWPGSSVGGGGSGPGSGDDRITIRLYETGPDTGVFVAYFPSISGAAFVNDDELSINSGSRLTATYVDSFDASEVSVDLAAVNPRGVVFDSLTGTVINGATVTIFDASTGLEAQVYAVDGFSSYPSSVVTGLPIIDGAGRTNPQSPGEFFFPYLLPGNYYITVTPPSGYVFSSTVDPSVLANLPTSPNVESGSYGDVFSLSNVSTLSLDIPLDPSASIVLTKEVTSSTGAIGDMMQYTIRVENRDTVPAPVNIRDIIPHGFRYRERSARVDGNNLVTPTINENGQVLLFSLSPLSPGDAVVLTYVLEIAAGTPLGPAINEAVVVDGDGDAISGIARAEILVRDDLLRSKATLIGRVAEQACDGDEEWARKIEDGKGVAGVRIYLETGDYAVSDKNGLFHFQGVTPGVHVVQLDEETLPPGFSPMMCEENTRFAGSMTSQFVDVKGGTLWRANFYLQRNEDYVEPVEAETEEEEPLAEYLQYDQGWLATQTPETAWVYPDTTKTPNVPNANIGIKHDPSLRAVLTLNGMAIPMTNFQARDKDLLNRVVISRWKGVDLVEGENRFRAELQDAEGNTVQVVEKSIYFVREAARAIPLPDQSTLIADGRSVPEIAVRFENGAGRPVHTGRIIKVSVEEPYFARNSSLREGDDPLTSSLSSQGAVAVGEDGIARIKLEPTLETGRVRLTAYLDDGRRQNITMYMKPEKRDWILVGMADGTFGMTERKPNIIPLGDGFKDEFSDGRVAFFAKGMVRGDWLLTMAYDSENTRKGADDGKFGDIDPNAYYTLYGDRSDPQNEAQSRYPFYVKLERETFQAMFGDYDTALSDSRLSRYQRRLTGFKSIYSGENVDLITFVAEDNQRYGREEIAADGTTGPFQITGAPIVRYSEKLRVETRGRYSPDKVLTSYSLNRFSDYEIDFLTGQIILRLPLDATDFDFNPNVLIVEYETAENAERTLTYGARLETQITSKARLGMTALHEEDAGGQQRGQVELVGADLVVDLSQTTQARFEYAKSTRENEYSAPGETAPRTGSAVLVELTHQSEKVTAELSYQKQDEGFGLGQNSSAVQNAERFSAEASVKLRDTGDAETGKRKIIRLETQIWNERNLKTDAERSAGEIMLDREVQGTAVGVGLRYVEDRLPNRDEQQSFLAIASLRHTFPDMGMTVSAKHESPIGGQQESTDFPQRTTLGVDKKLGGRATLNLRHEILSGKEVKGENTALGLSVQPWKGATGTMAVNQLTQDSAYRLGATVGLDQTIKLNKRWTASAGSARHEVIEQSGTFNTLLGDKPLATTELDEDFASYYGGIGYRNDKMALSLRTELRDAQSEDRYVQTLSAARELSSTLSLAGIARGQYKVFADQTDETDVDARLGLAYRPHGTGPAVLYRFDYKFDRDISGVETSRLISNLAANFDATERLEVSVHHGLKYVQVNFDGASFDGFTHLLGTEARFDITPRLDIGMHASGLWSENGKTVEYAYGPSIGFTPVDNVWISVGYNMSGFEDEDFAAAEYREQGAYIQFRMKLDQNTASGLLSRISPRP
jgi:uncharacterized repeat protein (TIGR01451 family)